MPQPSLTGLPIAITGAGSGIGRATAIACARAGMPVALAGRRTDRLHAVRDEITALGGRAVAIRCDVAHPDDCRTLIDACASEFGRIYAVFANAGYGLRGAVHELHDDAIRAIFETNFWGTLHTIRPALDHMIAARRGHVLICSSCLSKLGAPFTAPYSATKAAQDHFGRAMRLELAPLGIRVSTIHPIGVDTEFAAAAAARPPGADARNIPSPAAFTQSADRVARAIIACLRRPRGEVWTSLGARLAFAAAVACPGLADRVLRRSIPKPPAARP